MRTVFPPLGDPATFTVLVLQCLWTFYIVRTSLHVSLALDLSNIASVLSTALSFTLGLQLNSALQKNQAAINNYNACTGDLLALSWDVVALYNKEGDFEKDKVHVYKILDVLMAMPALIKHTFRGTIDIQQLTSCQRKFSSTQGGAPIALLAKKVGNGGMEVVDICFYKILDYIKDLSVNDKADERKIMIKTWSTAYGSWGNMANLNAYKTPSLVKNVLNFALAGYVVIIPFTYADQGPLSIAMVFLVSCFFLSLNMAGRTVGNAFTEDAFGFQSVSEFQKSATRALKQVYDSMDMVMSEDRLQEIDFKCPQTNWAQL